MELVALASYLKKLAADVEDFSTVDHRRWRDLAQSGGEWKGVDDGNEGGKKKS